MRFVRHWLFIGFGVMLILPGAAQAHFTLFQPPSAVAIEDGGKGGAPCGAGPDSNIVTAAQGGHPIAIKLSEFVFHPGHYRVALSVNSRSELPADPDVVQDANGNSISSSIQSQIKAPLLADGLFTHTRAPNGDWQTSLTLPNLNCEKCTLQIIEFMAQHRADFFYHHCADLKITADPNLPLADASWPRAAGAQTSAAFPHLAAGGGWSTVLSLINSSATAVPATVAFRGDDGSPLKLLVTTIQQGVAITTTSSSVSATINPNSTVLISTEDQSTNLTKGWADVQSSGPLGGYAVFRSSPPTGLPVEGAIPLQTQFPAAINVPFDNTAGFVTGIALANQATAPANITVMIWDESGLTLGSQAVQIPAGGHIELLPNQLPLTAGKRGLIKLQSPTGGAISAVALRLSQFGGFISLPIM